MKNISLFTFFLICLLSVSSIQAKTATSVWYFLNLSHNSSESDETLSVRYKFYHEYELGDMGPIPQLSIIIQNKQSYPIYINLAHSKILRNGQGESIHQSAIVIPPFWEKELKGIAIFKPGMEALFRNIFRFKEYMCVSNPIDIDCGEIVPFHEHETPFTIGGSIIYSAESDFSEAYELRTIYYVDKVIGSKWKKLNPTSQVDFKTMNKTYPVWNMPEQKYIRLWKL